MLTFYLQIVRRIYKS